MRNFSLGVLAGVLLTIVGSVMWVYLVYFGTYLLDTIDEKGYSVKSSSPYFSLESKAYLDSTPCTNFDLEQAYGTWSGFRYIQEEKTRQNWVVERYRDGTYEITFTWTTSAGEEESVESGLWSISGCLYSTITMSNDGSPVLDQEVYRIHQLNEALMEYTNYRTGNTFVVMRAAQ